MNILQLAGWFRLKFPQLIHASIASSAPVQAKVDMNEYNGKWRGYDSCYLGWSENRVQCWASEWLTN